MPARKMPARKLLATVIAGVLFLPTSGFTLGLGEIEVNSALNQKLNADIELLAAEPEDVESLIIKLASRKEFSRAGIDRPYLLSDLRFKPVVVDGVPHIKVTSGSPIREPYLDFLLEVDWPNGHLLREYTVLLDPPVFMTQTASAGSSPSRPAESSDGFRPSATGGANVVPVAAPAMNARPSAAEQVPAQSVQSSAQAPVQAPAYTPAPVAQAQYTANPPGSYRIEAGDTAWSLASAMRPDQSISVEQMMIAMLRANPESFINENVNGLKRGYILRIPDYNQITAISPAEARAMVREQAALWRQISQAQAGGQPVSAMPSESGAAADEVSEGEADARLAIVSAGSGSSTLGTKDPTQMTAEELRAELALARERVETEKVEKEALQKRIGELEQNINKMKGMLSIEDEGLSEVQALNQPAQPGEAGAMNEQDEQLKDVLGELSEATPEGSDEGLTQSETGAETMTEAQPEGAEAVVAEEGAEDITGEMAGEAPEEAVFTDEVAAGEGATEEGAETTAATELEQVEPAAQQPPVAQPSSLVTRPAPQDPLSRLLNDPILLAGAGGVLVLLLALVGIVIRKRRKASEEAASAPEASSDLADIADDISAVEETEAAEETVAEQAAEAEAAEETVVTEAAEENTEFDSDSTMVLDAQDTVVTEAPGEVAEEEEEERDDVIAEADVYLAYGIYQQAEELLNQAIADHPERDAYRVKLAETYYASKNTDAFLKVAEEIQKRDAGTNGPAWKKVMGMGQDMCADNPMFQGSMVGGLDVDSLAPKAPEMDIDLGMDEEGGETESPDLDLSFDEPLELPEEETADAEAEEAAAEPVDELEFDISDTGAVVEEEPAEDEFSLDIDASELDIDVEEEAPSTEADAEESAMELDDIDIGLDIDEGTTEAGDKVTNVEDIDLDFGIDEEAPAEEAPEEEEEISLDLSEEAEGMDLDLSEEETAEAGAESEISLDEPTAEAPAEESEEDEFDLSSLDDVDEISTKLDLARAYIDMGDSEGARGILEEVQADGNDEQKKEAGELMANLDG